ncbi:MAG: DUF4349 domain-containing protein [Actinomycetota bacterium]|nr:DUF4349 domain-containing protein [Actinomycetota bacterium]
MRPRPIRRSRSRPHRLSRQVAAVTAALVLGALAGCSGSGGGDLMDSDAGAGGQAESSTALGRAQEMARGSANRPSVQTRAVIRTGRISVTSTDLDRTRADVEELLVAVGGTLDREETSHDDGGEIERSTLVLRVPVAKFDAVVDALQKLGTMKSSQSTSKDVTTQVIDVDERVQTIQNSLDRLQSFQRQSNNIDDLVRFEDQITQRESQLTSLQAQQDYLADQTSMSTVTLYLSTPEKYVAPPDALEDAGFLSGLESGWNALKDAVVVAMTVLGALLPFLFFGALVGVPMWLLVRALRRRSTEPVPTPQSPMT